MINRHVINFRDVANPCSETWNPLASITELYQSGEPANIQMAGEKLSHLALSLYPYVSGDPYWVQAARNLFRGVVYALMECSESDQVTISEVYRFISEGQERYGGPNNTYLKEFVNMFDTSSIISLLLKSYATTADDTAAGIRSTCLDGLDMFISSPALMNMLSTDDLRVNHLDGEKPTAIYIVLPDENPCFNSLCGILCTELTTHYIRLAQEKHNGILPRRLNIILEELGNIGQSIPNLTHLMTASRSRNIRVQIVLQSITQLTDIYGASAATTILSNCDVTMAFRSNNWETLNELSQKCGSRMIDTGYGFVQEPLITPSQLGAMDVGQALIRIAGKIQYITDLPSYDEAFDNSDWIPPRNRSYIHQEEYEHFDIQSYVKNKKANKTNEIGRILSGTRSETSTNIEEKIDCFSSLFAKSEDRDSIDEYEVIITDTDNCKVKCIKLLKELNGLSLRDAKIAIDKLPCTVGRFVYERAKHISEQFEQIGAKIDMKKTEDADSESIEDKNEKEEDPLDDFWSDIGL